MEQKEAAVFRMKRNIKDTVFTRLFREKKYLLQLYQALHPEDTDTTEEDLKTITLEPIFVKDITNDLGFSVKDKLFILVEAQSTASVNIIVRSFMYLAHTYQEHFKETKQTLYGTKPVIIPKPELYVIFSCDTNIDKDILTLSEQFFGGEETAIEVSVKVITEKNSNGIIEQYILFTKVLDEQVKAYGYTKKAIDETLRICESYDILKEFLKEHEKEVADIMISLYSQEEIDEMYMHEVRRESEAKGRAKGRAEGKAEGKEDMVIEMLKDNEDLSKISKFSHFSLEKINEIKERLLNNVQLANE
ncbi:MAG: hypothetical protein LUG66_08830 [Clostridiales bacterium]|nr:hypothetical protein [Clostridiales bacterium]